MSENEIKPVAWMTLDGFEVAHPSDATEEYSEPLYDKSAIDRLKEELDDYAKAADFLELELAKFQIAADEEKAERDAAVAERDNLRSVIAAMMLSASSGDE